MMKETKSSRLSNIAQYLSQMENPKDAEFILEIKTGIIYLTP